MSDHEHPETVAVLHLRDGGLKTLPISLPAPNEIATDYHHASSVTHKSFVLRAFHYGEPPHEWHYDEVSP